METIYKKILICMLLLTFCSCAFVHHEPLSFDADNAMSTKRKFCLKDEKLQILKIKVSNGDVEAAVKLADHYTACDINPRENLYYREIAANNGGAVDKYNYALFLSFNDGDYKEYYDLEKSIFFMQKSSDLGFDLAKEMLVILKNRQWGGSY